MVKVLLFDFYGVFLPDAYGVWLSNNGLIRQGIFEELITALDTAKVTESEFLHQLSQAVGRDVTRDEIHSGHPELNTDLATLTRDLKAEYTTGLFSNASKKLRTKLDSLQIASLFDTVILSSEIGYAKPSDEAFRIAVDKLGVPAAEIMFIDDNPRNIDAARKNGLQAIHYTTFAALRDALRTNQIIQPADSPES